MNHSIVNDDISYHITQFLPITSLIALMSTNHYFYQIITCTPIYKELLVYRKCMLALPLCPNGDKFAMFYVQGLIRVLKNLHLYGHQCYDRFGIMESAENGHLEVLDWYIDHKIGDVIPRLILIGLLCNGNIYLLDWFEKKGLLEQMTCPFEVRRAIDAAIQTMPLGALQWLKNKGKFVRQFTYFSNIDERVHNHGATIDSRTIEYAATHNRIDILQWLKAEGCNFDHSRWPVQMASKKGHLAVLQWYYAHYDKVPGCEAITEAALKNHIPILEWLRVNNLAFGNVINSKERTHTISYTTEIVQIACQKNYLVMLHWIQSCGLYFNLTPVITDCCDTNEHLGEWLETNKDLVIAE